MFRCFVGTFWGERLRDWGFLGNGPTKLGTVAALGGVDHSDWLI